MDKKEVLKELILAGFGHFRGYNQTVTNYLHRIMKVACKLNLAYPYDFGKGKGKYQTYDNVSIEEVIEKLQNNPEALKITEKFIQYYERKVKAS